MYIKKLYLENFGRFHKKEIGFGRHINIIYGLNETGKSTVHKFIEGILFGFFKPYAKKRYYTQDHQKYLPWKGSLYNGAMIYAAGGTEYRIERDLLRGRDDVKIYDNITGKDITGQAVYNISMGLPEPASLGFGVSGVVYRNTMSISQAKSATEKELAGEVKEILLNMTDSGSEDISVAKAIAALNEKLTALGTSRTKTKKLGEACSRIEKLEEELGRSRTAYEEAYKLQEEVNSLKGTIRETLSGISHAGRDIDVIKNEGYKRMLAEGTELSGRIEGLRKEAHDLEKYEKVNELLYDKVLEDANTHKKLTADITDMEMRSEQLSDEKEKADKQIEDMGIIGDIDVSAAENLRLDFENLKNIRERLKEKINRAAVLDVELDKSSGVDQRLGSDYYRYEGLEREVQALRDDTEVQDGLEKECVMLKNSADRYRTMLFSSLVVAAAGIMAGVLSDAVFYAAAAAGAIISILSFSAYRKKVSSLRKAEAGLSEDRAVKEKRKAGIKDEMESILKAHDAAGYIELKKKYDSGIAAVSRKTEFSNERQELDIQISEAEKDISERSSYILEILDVILDRKIDLVTKEDVEEAENRYKAYVKLRDMQKSLGDDNRILLRGKETKEKEAAEINKGLKDIFAENGVSSMEGYRNAVMLKRKYLEYMKEIRNGELLLAQLLDGNSLESLKNLVRNDLEAGTEYGLSLSETQLLRDRLNGELSDAHIRQSRLEERIAGIEKANRPVVDVFSELEYMYSQKQGIEARIKAYETAIDAIKEISDRVRNDFAPAINKEICRIMRGVTDGKYDEIKVDSDMDVKAVDKESNILVGIDSLSIGTIDQLYFALRFAVLGLVEGNEKLPLLLDDCFVNYDSKRLKGILGYIYKEAQDSGRQVLLFTCHEREIDVMKEEGYDFDLVTI